MNTPPTALCTLSLHDALPIYRARPRGLPRARRLERAGRAHAGGRGGGRGGALRPGAARALAAAVAERRGEVERPDPAGEDRKSTRLNSSHLGISYAVFCLKKK